MTTYPDDAKDAFDRAMSRLRPVGRRRIEDALNTLSIGDRALLWEGLSAEIETMIEQEIGGWDDE